MLDWSLDATGQAALVRQGEVSAKELVEAAISRIEKLNPVLNAVVHQTFDAALTVAEQANDGAPFRGVPIVVKDLAPTAGDPHTAGSRFLRDCGYRAPHDSHVVERLRLAGFAILGRTNTSELGLAAATEPVAFGATANPWSLDHSTAGSSGGSAAAVASGMVSIAHASDGGGSLRLPASACGLVGLKPTRGSVSVGPDYGEFWAGMGIDLVLTRSVRDTAALLDVLAGPEPGDPYWVTSPRPIEAPDVGMTSLRVGLWDLDASVVHADCRAAAESTVALLDELGHKVEIVRCDELADETMRAERGLAVAAMTARELDRLAAAAGVTVGAGDVEADTWTLVQIGRTITATRYLEAIDYLARYTRKVARWWDASGLDVLVSPTMTAPPALLGELACDPEEPLSALRRSGEFALLTFPFNVTGQPAISVPGHWNDAGLPIGVQLAAAPCREDLLLQLAGQLEENCPWNDRWPPAA
jgi:amidase